MYGAKLGESSFANNCLLARRLVERGVRFVELFDGAWDHHLDIFGNLPTKCQQVDRPAAALVADLSQRGLLDDTLVVFCGEFGRTPLLQQGMRQPERGRDHHPNAFSIWMAGGGVQRGLTYGRTDDLGYAVVEDPVHVHDLQATILHLLGLDHERLTYRYQGRNFRLTDVAGEIVPGILA
jgi:arylsulfatase A-like enzyme